MTNKTTSFVCNAVDYLEKAVANGNGVTLGKKEIFSNETPIWMWDIVDFKPGLSDMWWHLLPD